MDKKSLIIAETQKLLTRYKELEIEKKTLLRSYIEAIQKIGTDEDIAELDEILKNL